MKIKIWMRDAAPVFAGLLLSAALFVPVAMTAYSQFALPAAELENQVVAEVVEAPQEDVEEEPIFETLNGLVGYRMGEPIPHMDDQQQCLAQAVYFEARSEPVDGQLAVAQVVLNRVEDRRYPDSTCDVVFQGEHRRNACQFSFACDGLSDTPRNAQAWRMAVAVAQIASEDLWEDVTDASTHYHADYVEPYWRPHLDERLQVGRHIFYRDHSF